MTPGNDQLLRTSLRGNAAFSTLCGVIALAFAAPLAGTLGIPAPIQIAGLGVQLLVFAGLLLWLASRPVIRVGLALAVVAADVLWVLGTVPLVASGALSSTGNWTALVIADVVALFALLQYLGVRRVRSVPELVHSAGS